MSNEQDVKRENIMQKPSEEKTSLLIWLLSCWWRPFAFLGLVGGFLGVTGLFAWLVLPGTLATIAKATGGGIEISAGVSQGVTIAIREGLSTKTTTVMTVPASRLRNDTGIDIEEGDTVTIKASGFVDTGNFVDWGSILKAPNEEKMRQAIDGRYFRTGPGGQCQAPDFFNQPLGKLSKELLIMQLRNDYRLTWRDPNGKLRYNVRPQLLVVDHDYKVTIDKWKACPQSEYGCLLGYLSYRYEDDDRDFPEGDLAEERVFEIGSSSTLQVSDGLVRHDHGQHIKLHGRKARLYLLANDCIVKQERLNLLVGALKEDLDEALKKKASVEAVVALKSLIAEYNLQLIAFDEDAMSDCNYLEKWTHNMRALWFLNNSGSFTVVIEKSHKRGWW